MPAVSEKEYDEQYNTWLFFFGEDSNIDGWQRCAEGTEGCGGNKGIREIKGLKNYELTWVGW